MASEIPADEAAAADVIFERIKGDLEATHLNQFVAIEPFSGDYYVGETLSEAIGASRAAHPNRLAYAFRIGRPLTVHYSLRIQ